MTAGLGTSCLTLRLYGVFAPFHADSSRCADMSGPSASPRGYQRCRNTAATAASVHFADADRLCRKIIEGKVMPTWLRSLVNAVPIPTKPPVCNEMIAPRDSWVMRPYNEPIPPGAPRLLA